MMLDMILQSARDFNLYLVALFAAAFIGGLAACISFYRKDRRLLRDQSLILDNVSQGICMFDSQKRLVLCNFRYLEIYKIQSKGIKRGTSLDEIVELRYSAGTNPKMTKDEYVRWRESIETTQRQSGTLVELMNGKIVEIRHQPMLDGGYVATHEDITDRQSEDRRRTIADEQEQRRERIDSAIANFRFVVEATLNTVVVDAGRLRTTAMSLSAVSDQTSKCAASAVQTSAESSSNVASASVSAEELSASISSITEQLRSASRLVEISVNEATKADAEIAGLVDSAGKIGNIVKLIHQIAQQTNLLALNATIEASRAGDVGRGFAVVAAEVKSLAAQTSGAIDQIANQVATVQKSSHAAAEAIHMNSTRMQEISRHTSVVVACVGRQNAATVDIARNVSVANMGSQTISASLKEVDRAATETQISSQTVLAASERVERVANELRESIVRFLKDVAA
jgi:methyl-accepting chemotaxis protein